MTSPLTQRTDSSFSSYNLVRNRREDVYQNSGEVKKSVEDVIDRLRFDLRHNMFRESKRFARTCPKALEAFLHSPNPTDPLGIETPDTNPKSADDAEKAFCAYDRGKWESVGIFVVVSATASCGPAAYSLFPWETIVTELGLLFLIPVLVAWLFIAIPVICLEQSLGQMLRGGPFKVFAMVAPRTVGVGVAMLLMIVLYSPAELIPDSFLLSVFASQSFGYFSQSFNSKLPWAITKDIREDCKLYEDPNACYSSIFCLPVPETGQCLASSLKVSLHYYVESAVGSVRLADAPAIHWTLLLAASITLIFTGLLLYFGPSLIGSLGCFTAITSFLILGLLILNTNSAVHPDDEIKLDSYIDRGPLYDFIDGEKWARLFSHTKFWAQGCIVAITSSFIVRGHHYVLASYTPIGSNIIRSAFAILALQIYVYLITSIILSRALASSKNQLQVLVDSNIATDSVPFFLCFLLFPVSLSYQIGAPIFSMLFFLVLWLQSIIRLALLGLMAVNAFMESKVFVRLHQIWCIIWVLLVFLWCGLPFVINFGRGGIQSYSLLGLIRTLNLEKALAYFAIPLSGCIQLYSLDVGYGWPITRRHLGWLGPYTRLALILLHCIWYGIFFWTLVARIEKYAASFLFVLASLLISFAIAAKLTPNPRVSYWTLLYSWTIAGMDTIRLVINCVMTDKKRQLYYLRTLWSFLLAIIIPFIFFLLGSQGLQQAPTATPFVIAACCAFLIPFILGLIRPNVSLSAAAAAANFGHAQSVGGGVPTRRRWTIFTVPRRRLGEKYAFRRPKIKVWEEFSSVTTIWSKTSELRYVKV